MPTPKQEAIFIVNSLMERAKSGELEKIDIYDIREAVKGADTIHFKQLTTHQFEQMVTLELVNRIN